MVPELWPDACDHLSRELNAYSTAIITIHPNEGLRWVSSPRIAEQMDVYQKSGLAQRTKRPQIGLQLAPGSFLRDIDLLSPEALKVDPLRVELLEPIGLAGKWARRSSSRRARCWSSVFWRGHQTVHSISMPWNA